MSPTSLRLIFAYDRARFALLRRRLGAALEVEPPVSPNLRLAQLSLEPEARLAIGRGFATERQAGNHIRLEARARLSLGERAWLRTQYGPNYLTAHAGARIEIGPDALVNGAMLHAKAEIRIGCEARIGFGVRVLDADLHDLDCKTPERIEPVSIGDRVWLGAGVLVLRGVTIGDDTVVGAGSIVTSDLPGGCLAVGAPARPIRELEGRRGCR